MIDLDAFEERAAIMEFDGGLTRFQAETKAARAQGMQRRDMLDAIREARKGGCGGDIASGRTETAQNGNGLLAGLL